MNPLKRQSLQGQKIHSLITFWNEKKKTRKTKIYFKHFPYIYKMDNQIHIRFRHFQEWYNNKQSKRKASQTIQRLRTIAFMNDPQCTYPCSFRDFIYYIQK